MVEATADAVQACHREVWNDFGGAGQQVPRANTVIKKESEVDKALEAGGREG